MSLDEWHEDQSVDIDTCIDSKWKIQNTCTLHFHSLCNCQYCVNIQWFNPSMTRVVLVFTTTSLTLELRRWQVQKIPEDKYYLHLWLFVSHCQGLSRTSCWWDWLRCPQWCSCPSDCPDPCHHWSWWRTKTIKQSKVPTDWIKNNNVYDILSDVQVMKYTNLCLNHAGSHVPYLTKYYHHILNYQHKKMAIQSP